MALIPLSVLVIVNAMLYGMITTNSTILTKSK